MLFDPTHFPPLNLPNRIVYSPILEFQATRGGQVTDAMRRNYMEYARQGVGLVILESAYVHLQGRSDSRQLGLAEENHIPGLSTLIAALHNVGARVGVRLSHAGARTSEVVCGEQPLAPSATSQSKEYSSSREFHQGDVEELISHFVHAAERAEEAGADLVELNGAQHLLLDQCLSRRSNSRSDVFGGDLSQRLELPKLVLDAVRKRLSAHVALSYMFCVQDKLDEGFSSEHLRTMLELLAPADVLHPINQHVMTRFFGSGRTLIEWICQYAPQVVIAEGSIKSPQVLRDSAGLGLPTLFALDKAIFVRPNWSEFLKRKLLPS